MNLDFSCWGRLGANAELDRDVLHSGSVLRHRKKIPARPFWLDGAWSINRHVVIKWNIPLGGERGLYGSR